MTLKIISNMVKMLVLTVAITFLSSCENIENISSRPTPLPPDFPVTIGEMTFNESPATVVSLSPAVTELITVLGFSEKLVGRSIYCDAADLPEAGSAANPDINQIITLSPKVLISQSPIATHHVSQLQGVGIDVLILPPPMTLVGMYDTCVNLAELFVGQNKSVGLSDAIFEPLQGVVNKKPADKTFIYIMSPELVVADNSTLAGDLLSRFGVNVLGESGEAFKSEAPPEADMLFISSGMEMSDLPKSLRSEWSAIYKIDNSAFERATPKRLAAVADALEMIFSTDSQ